MIVKNFIYLILKYELLISLDYRNVSLIRSTIKFVQNLTEIMWKLHMHMYNIENKDIYNILSFQTDIYHKYISSDIV